GDVRLADIFRPRSYRLRPCSREDSHDEAEDPNDKDRQQQHQIQRSRNERPADLVAKSPDHQQLKGAERRVSNENESGANPAVLDKAMRRGDSQTNPPSPDNASGERRQHPRPIRNSALGKDKEEK